MAERDDAILQRTALGAEFGKAAVEDDRGANPFGGDLFILRQDAGIADAEGDEVDAVGQVVDRGVAAVAEDFVVFGINRIDLAAIADRVHRFDQHPAERGIDRRAQNGNRARLKERFKTHGRCSG